MTGPNDPTRAGFSPYPHARLSRNEVEMLCLKAARGAGYDWGMAEEAGSAAGWLQDRGVDACGAVLLLLGSTDVTRHPAMPDSDHWRAATAAPLCPVVAGTLLSDFSQQAARRVETGLQVGPVMAPALMLASVARLASHMGRPLSVSGDSFDARITPKGDLSLNGDPIATAVVTIRTATPQATAAAATAAPVSDTTIAALNEYAMKTTVPASARSRSDAGSGDADND